MKPESLLDQFEREFILKVLEEHDGNRVRTARKLGISIRTLRNKLERYRLRGIFIPPSMGRVAQVKS